MEIEPLGDEIIATFMATVELADSEKWAALAPLMGRYYEMNMEFTQILRDMYVAVECEIAAP